MPPANFPLQKDNNVFIYFILVIFVLTTQQTFSQHLSNKINAEHNKKWLQSGKFPRMKQHKQTITTKTKEIEKDRQQGGDIRQEYVFVNFYLLFYTKHDFQVFEDALKFKEQ